MLEWKISTKIMRYIEKTPVNGCIGLHLVKRNIEKLYQHHLNSTQD